MSIHFDLAVELVADQDVDQLQPQRRGRGPVQAGRQANAIVGDDQRESLSFTGFLNYL